MSYRKCEVLDELFKRVEKSTNRDYWVMTELFCYLHNGRDYCREKDGTNTPSLNLKLAKQGIYPEAKGKRPKGTDAIQPEISKESCCVNVYTCSKAKELLSNCFSCKDYNNGIDIFIRPIKKGEVFS